MKDSPTRRLATIALGEDVVEWIATRRGPDPERPLASFQQIADELHASTEVRVTDQTVATWLASREQVAS